MFFNESAIPDGPIAPYVLPLSAVAVGVGEEPDSRGVGVGFGFPLPHDVATTTNNNVRRNAGVLSFKVRASCQMVELFRHRCCGKLETNDGATALACVREHRAAGFVDHLLHDRESKPGTGLRTRSGRTIETIEDVGEI